MIIVYKFPFLTSTLRGLVPIKCQPLLICLKQFTKCSSLASLQITGFHIGPTSPISQIFLPKRSAQVYLCIKSNSESFSKFKLSPLTGYKLSPNRLHMLGRFISQVLRQNSMA